MSSIISEFLQNSQELNVLTRRRSSHLIVQEESIKKFEHELKNYHLANVGNIASYFNSSITNGLSLATAFERLQKFGPNVVKSHKEVPIIVKFLLAFLSGFAPLLWIAVCLVFLSWEPFGTPPTNIYNLILAIVLILVITISSLFSFYQELEALKILKGFEDLLPSTCIVIREGERKCIQATEIVVGDLIYLQAGKRVPSDLRIVTCSSLTVDKSMLTGESEPVKLNSNPENVNTTLLESRNVAFMGCNIYDGEGTGIVFATGNNNQLAKVIIQATIPYQLSSLQKEVNRLVYIITGFALVTCTGAVLVWTFYLRVQHPGFMTLSSMIANVISLAVAFVPEGLPLALNTGLAIIANRLCSRYHVLVKRLGLVETLGSISILASDKTGTLTQNKMCVTKHMSSLDMNANECITLELSQNSDELYYKSYRVAVLCNQATLSFNCDRQLFTDECKRNDEISISINDGIDNSLSKAKPIGSNATDRALLSWAFQFNKAAEFFEDYEVLSLLPFSSVTKISAVLVRNRQSSEIYILVKGAPEFLISSSTYYAHKSGNIEVMSADLRSKFIAMVNDEASQAHRTIALAQIGPISHEIYPVTMKFEKFPSELLINFTLISCLAISDPPKIGVTDTISHLHLAGIKVAMVTGDSPVTALAISIEIGIVTDMDNIDILSDVKNNCLLASKNINDIDLIHSAILVNGNDLLEIHEQDWRYILKHKEFVFARTSPEQKLEIVSEFQKCKELVGVTGDGANDSPALKRADIGIAMNSGSDVAKDAASIVLLNNDFNAVVPGIREGRLIFENLRKVIAYQVSAGCWSEALPVLATFLIGMPQPLSAFLMIMISCISDVYAGIALMNEKPEQEIMLKQPRNIKTDRLFDLKLVLYSYLFYGNMISIGAFYNYFMFMAARGNTREITSATLPVDDDGERNFPIGYRADQLIFAWNWGINTNQLGKDQIDAASVGSSIFYLTIVIGQMGHLLSVRRKTPYFYNFIVKPDSWASFLKEIELKPTIAMCWLGSVVTVIFFLYVPIFNKYCGTSPVPGKFWGYAVGWSLLWFIIAEIRKWLIVLYPNSLLGKLAW